MSKKNSGFTLIELLAVLVILAIIALIITPIVTELIKDARIKAAENATEGLLNSVDIYYGREILKSNGVFKQLTTDTAKVTIKFDGKTGGVTGSEVDGDVDVEFTGFTVDGGSLTVDRYGVKTINASDPLQINGYKCTNTNDLVKCVE